MDLFLIYQITVACDNAICEIRLNFFSTQFFLRRNKATLAGLEMTFDEGGWFSTGDAGNLDRTIDWIMM